MCISFANRKQKLPTIDIHFGQCDQMWQNYVTLAELHKSLAFFEGILLYLANFLTYNSNFLCYWPTIIACNGQKN